MLTARSVVSIFSVAMTVLGAGGVSGQDYPSKTIRIVASEPGGGRDFAARLIAQGISGPLGQPVIVDNRGGQILMGEVASKATPDGYTMLVASGTFWIGPLLQKTPYDVAKDFAPVVLTDTSPGIMAVHPSLPVPIKSVKELIALAKARPGGLNYSSSAPGSSTHLAAELFKAMAGVDVVRISYKGGGPAVNAVIRGEVQLTISTAGSVAPHLKSGRLRALAVTSLQPSVLFPGLPTVADSGVPGYEFIGFGIIVVPAKTPAAIINRLNQEIVRFLKTTEAKEQFFNHGEEVAGSSPEELGNKLKSEEAKWGKVIKEAGIRTE